jgi:taurine dioxygenase
MTIARDTLSVTRVAGALGAEVRGVALADVDEATFTRIRDLLCEHLVLFFPAQHLDPDEHRAFAARFGEMEIHPFIPKLDAEHPEIVVLRSSQGQIADVWHTDVTFSASPPICSVLHMQRRPQGGGGDTMWSNQQLVYESLSAPLKELLTGLTAVHHAAVFGHPEQTAEHPVVRSHPVTGRPSLFVNRQFTSHIPQLSRAESKSLLEFLYAFSEQPPFTCRYRWNEGDVGIWDNRATQHYALNDYAGERVIHRVTILGDNPEPVADVRRWPAHDPGRTSASRFTP